MINILKKLNTVITVVSAIYTVIKIMLDTFKWYEKKHGNNKKQIENDKGRI